MKLSLPRKGQRIVIGLLLLVNVVCLLTFGRTGMSRAFMGHLDGQMVTTKQTIVVNKSLPIVATHAPVSTFVRNDKVKLKVDQLKYYLNESTVSRKPNPADKIGRYVMVDPNRCKDVGMVDVVILVHTAPNNFDKRQRMRDSFAKDSLFYPFHVRIAFLLGRTKNATIQRVLWMEHATYNDTVMGDFVDDYHNLTLKGVMGYRWVKDYCQNSKFILKIDDDVLVNMYKLLYSFTAHMNGKKKSIFCNVWKKSTMGIMRKGKWKVENHVFSNMTSFPYDYCSGFVVLLTSDLMKPLYEAATITPFFWIDDVYLFGMLPSVVGGVTYYNYALNKNMTLDDKKAINCTKEQGARCPIFATIISPNSYWSYWSLIRDLYITPGAWSVEHRVVE